jgi:putative transposase
LTGPNPTDRGKRGTKRHLLTDKNGMPLSVVITTAANTHDMKAAITTIDRIVVKRLSPKKISYRTYVLIKDMTFWR